MKLRNNKSVPFLGKNLPKRKRKNPKTSPRKPLIEVLPKPVFVAAEIPEFDVEPPTAMTSPVAMTSPTTMSSPTMSTSSEFIATCREIRKTIPILSDSNSSEPKDGQEEEIQEQYTYEQDSHMNKSLKRFSHGTPISSRSKQINSTMYKGTNTSKPKEFSFDFGQVEHQSTIIETPEKDYRTTSPPPLRYLSLTMETESDTEDEAYHAQLNKDQFPIPYADESNDKEDMTIYSFNSEDSNEISLIPETDSDDSDLPRRSFDLVALTPMSNDNDEAPFGRIQQNKAELTDTIIPTCKLINQL